MSTVDEWLLGAGQQLGAGSSEWRAAEARGCRRPRCRATQQRAGERGRGGDGLAGRGGLAGTDWLAKALAGDGLARTGWRGRVARGRDLVAGTFAQDGP